MRKVNSSGTFVPILYNTSGAMSFHVLAKFIVVYAEMLQLLGDFVPQTLYRGSAPGPRWGTPSPRPLD